MSDMVAAPEPPPRGASSVLRALLFAVSLLVAAAALILLLLGNAFDHGHRAETFIALGSALAGSLAFAVLYTDRTDKYYRAEFHEMASGIAAGAHAGAYEAIRAQFDEFLPSHTFPASNDDRPELMKLLRADVGVTKRIQFRGLTGRDLPKRLLDSDRVTRIEAILADPTAKQASLAVAMRPEDFGLSRAASAKDRANAVRLEIWLTVVELFDMRDERPRLEIKFAFDPAPSPLRLEIFDSAVYRAMYQPKEAHEKYPLTYRYKAGAVTYHEADETFESQLRTLPKPASFDSHSTDDDLAEQLKLLGCDKTIAELRARVAEGRRRNE
jgi:hypothetical protein